MVHFFYKFSSVVTSQVSIKVHTNFTYSAVGLATRSYGANLLFGKVNETLTHHVTRTNN